MISNLVGKDVNYKLNPVFEIVSEKVYNRADFPLESMLPYDELKIPERGTPGSAGYDFFSPVEFTLEKNESIVIPTFVRFFGKDSGTVLLLLPKSGLGFKYNMRFANTVGVVDSDYYDTKSDDLTDEGNILVNIINGDKDVLHIEKGQKLFQGVIVNFMTVINDNILSDVRNGGFGSTGK